MPFYDYYDETPATGIGYHMVQMQADFVCKRIMRASNHEPHILEIGPGRGVFADIAHSNGIAYVALDINRKLLSGIGQRGHAGIAGMAPQLPINDAAFSIAFASHVIEHSPNYRDALNFLEEMRRVVHAGGLVALVAPDYLALREDFWNCDYSHSFVTTRRRLRQIMRDSQLTIVDECPIYGPLAGNLGALPGAILGSSGAGAIARAIPGKLGERLYKVRLTFSRAWLIIGQVT